ncbi:MAG: hypothetical protein D084_Lepto4C00500G0003 [Leptospirillum sp. Group IV 'UBA BS']|nr:MAG: hypothetical protein D084_Lepto4C00500G0003 [Leptospirillum sp. Group IV 'UBA BS']
MPVSGAARRSGWGSSATRTPPEPPGPSAATSPRKSGKPFRRIRGSYLIDPGQIYEALHEDGHRTGASRHEEAARSSARKVGADVLVIGTYTDLGQKIDIQSRLVALPDGQQLGLFSRKIPKTGEVLNLIKVGP